MDYEIVFQNKYLKVIRLCYGALINIYKADMNGNLDGYIKNKRKDLTKIDDKFYKTNVDIFDNWHKTTYPKGTILYKENSCTYKVVGSILNQDKWYWEIKTTGNALSGYTEEFKDILNTINQIVIKEI